MKRIKIDALIVITLLFFVFCVGLYIGRRGSAEAVTISKSVQESTGEKATESRSTSPTGTVPLESTPLATQTAETEATDGKININTATQEQLRTLPGIGEVIAQRILDYRNEHGSFESIYDLNDVPGIGEKRIEALLEYVTVG